MKILELFGSSFILCICLAVEVRVGAMTPRIVRGSTAAEGEFPYQISLRLRNSHICGGSVISNNYVLTAAHCVTRKWGGTIPASDVSIRAGSINVNSDGELVNISQIKIHPKFKFPNNDVALLKLATHLEYTKNIKPIKLVKDAVRPGTSILASGWGYLSTGGASPNKLQYVSLQASSDERCTRYLGVRRPTVLCAIHRLWQGVCQGDSGGPAVHNGFLVGVVSFTDRYCASKYPDGFAKISALRGWIINNSDVN